LAAIFDCPPVNERFKGQAPYDFSERAGAYSSASAEACGARKSTHLIGAAKAAGIDLFVAMH
jgi:hypothetical protein